AFVDTADATPQYGSAKPSPVSNRIAEHIVDLLPRNPTLQIGIDLADPHPSQAQCIKAVAGGRPQ
ncbi:hypothetical protein BST36_30755, partial [Mycolicibacterium moriokaense]|uniref:hypothetical protein n=1 Tax=Mycolicibacterium moriokaense TaxID=39691 RepID=UPI000A0E71FD